MSCRPFLIGGMVVSAALLVSCASPVAAPPQSAVPSPSSTATERFDRNAYKLGPGDRIRVDVFGEPDLSIEGLVDAGGSISYPLLGRVRVQGYTLKALEANMMKLLSNGYLVKPSVRVGMVQFRPFYVTGQVNKVGAYPYVEGLSVEKAIAMAGGMTNIGSERKMFLLREGASGQRQRVGLQTVVFPGDTLIVEESLF